MGWEEHHFAHRLEQQVDEARLGNEMPVKDPYPEDLVISFVRIGQSQTIPDLDVPAGRPDHVCDVIHRFVAEHLGRDTFTIQLWGEGGFIDMGTHSAGAFRIRTAGAVDEDAGRDLFDIASLAPEGERAEAAEQIVAA